jgi:hypothetical protein
LPRLSHPSAELALETRVAPHIRCTSAASQRAIELPRTLVFRLLPVMDLRWPPNLASFVGPGVEFPGSPEASPSSAAARSVPGSPRILDLPALPRLNPRVAPKLRFPRLAEWWLFGFPRFPHLPAMPAVNFRVAPNLRSSGCACCGVSSRLEIPPFSAPGDQVLSRLSPLIFRRIRFTIPRVAPFPRFFVCASDGVSGCPVASHPPGLPLRVFAFPRFLLQRPVR